MEPNDTDVTTGLSSETMTIAEVAELYKVDISTVRRWADSGKLPHWRTPGGQRRFNRSDVDALRQPVDTPPTEAVS